MTRSRAVAAAVVRRAQVRAAFEHLAGNFDLRLARVVALLFTTAPRILRNTAGLRCVRFVPSRPPIGGPFPNVADHVVESVAVRRKSPDRGGSLVAVGRKVFVREGSLPSVCHLVSAGRELIAPGEFGAVKPAARGELPLGLRG